MLRSVRLLERRMVRLLEHQWGQLLGSRLELDSEHQWVLVLVLNSARLLELHLDRLSERQLVGVSESQSGTAYHSHPEGLELVLSLERVMVRS